MKDCNHHSKTKNRRQASTDSTSRSETNEPRRGKETPAESVLGIAALISCTLLGGDEEGNYVEKLTKERKVRTSVIGKVMCLAAKGERVYQKADPEMGRWASTLLRKKRSDLTTQAWNIKKRTTDTFPGNSLKLTKGRGRPNVYKEDHRREGCENWETHYRVSGIGGQTKSLWVPEENSSIGRLRKQMGYFGSCDQGRFLF